MNYKLILVLSVLAPLLVACTAPTKMDTSNHVYWMIEASVNDGQLDNLKAMNKEMVKAAKSNEQRTLSYDWSISADGKTCYFFERYADSAAVMIHLGTFGEKFADRLMKTITIKKFDVYGKPNTEVQEALGGFGAKFHESIGGFAR